VVRLCHGRPCRHGLDVHCGGSGGLQNDVLRLHHLSPVQCHLAPKTGRARLPRTLRQPGMNGGTARRKKPKGSGPLTSRQAVPETSGRYARQCMRTYAVRQPTSSNGHLSARIREFRASTEREWLDGRTRVSTEPKWEHSIMELSTEPECEHGAKPGAAKRSSGEPAQPR
jgi:hypothetical protein